MTSKMANPIRIGISLGGTANFQDGLGEFSYQLGTRMAQRAPELRERFNVTFHFHLRDALVGVFGDDVSYLPVTRWQRWSHSQKTPFALWHKLNQLNKTRPPNGTQHRLVTVHDLNFLYFKANYSQWRDLRRIKHLLKPITRIVTISEYVRQDVIRQLGWDNPIEVIYNGARSFLNSPQEALPGWDGKPYMFHLSRMTKSKNITAILELAEHWPEMNFILAGPENKDTRKIRAYLQKTPLHNIKVFLSISDRQKAWLYANCAGFIFPSITEGFGLPPIEAMHFGKPVFLSDRTCLPEIGGAFSAYFTDFSPESMKSVIETGLQRLNDCPEKIKGHAAKFTWDECAKQYLSLYGQLLDLPF